MASVICTINKGDFPLNISWTLNGKPITSINGINVVKTNKRISQLSIESIQAKHAGRYICIASNAAGTATHTADLHVNGIFVFLYLLQKLFFFAYIIFHYFYFCCSSLYCSLLISKEK